MSTNPTHVELKPCVHVVAVEPIVAEITVEREDRSGMMTGDRFIWARHPSRPHLDTLLVTVHYSYAYQDNSTIPLVAQRLADALAGREPAIAVGATRPPASAAPVDELVERLRSWQGDMPGDLKRDLLKAADQLTIYARRVAVLAWQPIDTAPRDGAYVLITKAGWDTMAVASFDGGEWCDMGDMGWGGYCDVEPTHWMPLPPPPATEGDSQ